MTAQEFALIRQRCVALAHRREPATVRVNGGHHSVKKVTAVFFSAYFLPGLEGMLSER